MRGNKRQQRLSKFATPKQSLEDVVGLATKVIVGARKGFRESSEEKAAAKGATAFATKDLADDKDTFAGLRRNYDTKAQDFEAAAQSRAEELKALMEARRVIFEIVGGAQSITCKSDAFFTGRELEAIFSCLHRTA